MTSPCLVCGRPTVQRVASLAAHVRGSFEILLDELAWPTDPVVSRAIDWLVALEEAGQ